MQRSLSTTSKDAVSNATIAISTFKPYGERIVSIVFQCFLILCALLQLLYSFNKYRMNLFKVRPFQYMTTALILVIMEQSIIIINSSFNFWIRDEFDRYLTLALEQRQQTNLLWNPVKWASEQVAKNQTMLNALVYVFSLLMWMRINIGIEAAIYRFEKVILSKTNKQYKTIIKIFRAFLCIMIPLWAILYAAGYNWFNVALSSESVPVLLIAQYLQSSLGIIFSILDIFLSFYMTRYVFNMQFDFDDVQQGYYDREAQKEFIFKMKRWMKFVFGFCLAGTTCSIFLVFVNMFLWRNVAVEYLGISMSALQTITSLQLMDMIKILVSRTKKVRGIAPRSNNTSSNGIPGEIELRMNRGPPHQDPINPSASTNQDPSRQTDLEARPSTSTNREDQVKKSAIDNQDDEAVGYVRFQEFNSGYSAYSSKVL